MAKTPLSFALAIALAGCAAPPDVPGMNAVEHSAPWPQLVPIEDIMAQGQPVRVQPSDTANVQARARALRERAERLRRRTL